jgi:hypothetical protein
MMGHVENSERHHTISTVCSCAWSYNQGKPAAIDKIHIAMPYLIFSSQTHSLVLDTTRIICHRKISAKYFNAVRYLLWQIKEL